MRDRGPVYRLVVVALAEGAQARLEQLPPAVLATVEDEAIDRRAYVAGRLDALREALLLFDEADERRP